MNGVYYGAGSSEAALSTGEHVFVVGGWSLEAITLRNNPTGDTRRAETRNLFLCLGGVPYTEWANDVGIVRDSEGYLMTGPDLLKGSDGLIHDVTHPTNAET